MNEKFLALMASCLFATRKILESSPTIATLADIFGGEVADIIPLENNLEEEFI